MRFVYAFLNITLLFYFFILCINIMLSEFSLRMYIHLSNDDNLAEELAEKYRYQPYMIKRYLAMFGKEETVEFHRLF